ncbi:hypothetical protein HanHA300_Chr12g0440301 [Helianthus annuus]|nr:hypothetical protein HanHA300_Chr12g0440301 [Helianthus annuus]KAJ0504993.1 hypothetical protein HanHA89_Chr12g0465411 [Helianthus annuus]KAJ0674676.1 hypothetical protein HanLR1_Chr12g0442531 [Helianthus annuus]
MKQRSCLICLMKQRTSSTFTLSFSELDLVLMFHLANFLDGSLFYDFSELFQKVCRTFLGFFRTFTLSNNELPKCANNFQDHLKTLFSSSKPLVLQKTV